MRKLTLMVLTAAALVSSVTAIAKTDSEANPYWSGCVIARQFTASGTIAIDRVCSVPNHTFSIFEPYQLGARPKASEASSPTVLSKADLRFTAFRSRYARGDGRQARLQLYETGPAQTQASYSYDIELAVDQEAIVTMPSGISIGIRMDPSNVPTSYDNSLSMPTWNR